MPPNAVIDPEWEIAPAALKQLLDAQASDIVLLDCRQPAERAAARIEGDAFIPLGQLASRLDELARSRDKRVVVYCHHGERSLRAARLLRRAGFPRACSLAGGVDLWSRAIDPAVPRYERAARITPPRPPR